jgi:hypothetical protein
MIATATATGTIASGHRTAAMALVTLDQNLGPNADIKETAPAAGGELRQLVSELPAGRADQGLPAEVLALGCTKPNCLSHELFQQPLNTEHPNHNDDPEHG